MDRLIENPKSYFEDIKRFRYIILYGAGSKARQTIRLLEQWNIHPCAICDSNKDLHGQLFLNRYLIKSYESIREEYESYCIVITTSMNYAENIKNMLLERGERNPIFHVCNLFKVDEEFLRYNDVICDQRYTRIYDLLEDDVSKNIFIKNVNAKLTGNGLRLYEEMQGGGSLMIKY